MKNMPILGSHNTMTYLKPFNRIGRLIKFMAKCQNASYKDQYYVHGVRMFDIRLFFDEKGRGMFKHGIAKYSIASIFQPFEFFNDKKDCMVRILLEESKKESRTQYVRRIEERFQKICDILEKIYPNIKFFGGERKFDWKKLYYFKYEKENGAPRIKDLYSSTTSLFDSSRHGKNAIIDVIDDWYPFVYAKIFNKKNFKRNFVERDDVDIVLVDFVDMK